MQRIEVAQICEREALESAARLFGTAKAALGTFVDYEGCANWSTTTQTRASRASCA